MAVVTDVRVRQPRENDVVGDRFVVAGIDAGFAELELTKVRSARRLFDPVGHYHRPDVFRLDVDTAPRPVVTTRGNGVPPDLSRRGSGPR